MKTFPTDLVREAFSSESITMIEYILSILGPRYFDASFVLENFCAVFQGRPSDVELFSYIRNRFGGLEPSDIPKLLKEIYGDDTIPMFRENLVFSLFSNSARFDRRSLAFLHSIGFSLTHGDLVEVFPHVSLSGIEWIIEHRPQVIDDKVMETAEKSGRRRIQDALKAFGASRSL